MSLWNQKLKIAQPSLTIHGAGVFHLHKGYEMLITACLLRVAIWQKAHLT